MVFGFWLRVTRLLRACRRLLGACWRQRRGLLSAFGGLVAFAGGLLPGNRLSKGDSRGLADGNSV